MDLSLRIVPDQLADENYIERLFPKCPPKPQQRNNNNNYSHSDNRERKNFKTMNNERTRRQTRPKVHQLSKRELEARRNKSKASPSSRRGNGHSSGSSDDQATSSAVATTSSRGLARQCNSNGSNSTQCSQPVDDTTYSSPQPTTMTTTTKITRRSGKYLASQSLLRQLQRSQSGYNNSSAPLIEQKQLAPTSELIAIGGGDQSRDMSNQSSEQVREQTAQGSRFVKSNSSSAFVANESSSSSSSIARAPPKYRRAKASLKTATATANSATSTANSATSTVLSNPPASLGNYDTIITNNINNNQSNVQSRVDGLNSNKNNDDIQSDVLDRNEQPSGPIVVPTARSFDVESRSILRSSRVRGDCSIDSHVNHSVSFDNALDNSSSQAIMNERQQEAFVSSNTVSSGKMIERRNGGDSGQNNNNNNTIGREKLFGNEKTLSSGAHSSGPKLSSAADLEVRCERSEEVERNTTPNNTSSGIISSFDRASSPSRQDAASNLMVKRHDSLDGSDYSRKDEEKYINLFVYDNSSYNPQKPTDQNSSEQRQTYSYSRYTRYRPRGKQFPISGNSNGAGKSNFDGKAEITEFSEPSSIAEVIRSSPVTDLDRLPQRLIDEDQAECNPVDIFKVEQSEKITTPNVIAINHQASQQLLTPDTNDNEEFIVRNDASTEELCAIDDNVNERNANETSLQVDKDTEKTIIQRSELEEVLSYNSGIKPSNNRHASSMSNLQTVDEKAENNNDGEESNLNYDMVEKDSDIAYANMPNLIKRAFQPPGHPQRIRPSILTETLSSPTGKPNLHSREPRQRSSPSTSERLIENEYDLNNEEISTKSAMRSTNRVKFVDDNNQTSPKSDTTRGGPIPQESIKDSAVLVTPPDVRRNEHPRQMPIISEAQSESEHEVVVKNDIETTGVELSSGLSKVSISNTYGDDIQSDLAAGYVVDPLTTEQSAQKSVWDKNMSLYLASNEAPSIASQLNINSKTGSQEHSAPSTTLRHHKLPNESSHFSIVRSGNTLGPNNSDLNSAIPIRSSTIHFNTLSGGESEPDDSQGLIIRHTGANRNFNSAKKCDASQIGSSSKSSTLITSPANSNKNNDDDLMPTTKTALIFPRLDEGLSSEAESCDDEVEDEDDKAIDGDIDADDDEDDEDIDDDDGVDDDNPPLERNSQVIQLGQSNVDCFMRQQSQQLKPQNRLVGSIQQPALVEMAPEQSDLHQGKSAVSAYSGYPSQETLDHSDLKSMSNYQNQNGQSNYWMGVSSHPPNLPSQPASSQHFNQRNQTSNSMSKGNNSNSNSFNRDEVKVTTRLSSDTDNETDRLLGTQRSDQLKIASNDVGSNNSSELQPVSTAMKQNSNSREVLIEGVLFNVKYLGSTHSDCEGRSEKEDRIHQAEMAVHEVKFRNGDSQAAIEVQLFISTEKIMVLDDKHRKIMMDHSLRTISYIADIGDAIVLIVRKKNSSSETASEIGRPVSKISCHVFESSESHTITKSISQAFQVAYTELLKANGTGETNNYLPKELDYQEVLNSQEMSTDELEMFARKENQREVIVPKEKGEILGLSIVESGWGSVLPTVVIANLKHDGPAYRCKRLSIGDQILSVNGISLVGLPLTDCQEILRKTKNQTVARLSVVPCPITVEVKIKRPDTKYQLGFSVQNGVICSLLRGGIAERGGVRVGHRIMSINGTTVVGVPHEKIVTLLASSVGEIRMKTCLTSLYRLILGEENPVHF